MTRRRVSDDERALFEDAFKGTIPLKKPNPKKAVAKPAPKIVAPRPPEFSGIDGGTDRELRKGALAPDARLDLHGMTESAAHHALTTFVRGAGVRGLRLLLIVTGKGAADPPDAPFDLGARKRGVLKTMAPRWLRESELAPFVADIRAAHRRHGGDGALYVYLRKTRR
ncbi:MAG TPA: Smr/MutS family protein [Rhizomicrobium sp.]|nr:Smr/MutS family protein [Rhizomicrobium sp.]